MDGEEMNGCRCLAARFAVSAVLSAFAAIAELEAAAAAARLLGHYGWEFSSWTLLSAAAAPTAPD